MLVGAPLAHAKKRKKRSARPEDVRIKSRTLHGHRFLSSEYLDDPFITSYASSSTGFGAQSLSFEIGGCDEDNGLCEVDLPKYKYVLVRQLFQAQVGILDRVAINAGIVGDFEVGRDARTAFDRAVAGGVNGLGGIKVKIYDNKWVQFAGSASMSRGKAQDASPSNVLNNTVQYIYEGFAQGEFRMPSESQYADWLFSRTSTGSYSIGGHGAYSPHKSVGFVGSLNYQFEKSLSDADDATVGRYNYLITQLGVSSSLARVFKPVPLGAMLGLQRQFRLKKTDFAEQALSIISGLYYAGRDYLDLGLEYEYGIVRAAGDMEDDYPDPDDPTALYIDQVRFAGEGRVHMVHTRLRVYF